MAEFFAMDGYGGFIWPAYLLPFVLMLAVWLQSRKALADSHRTIERLQADLDAEQGKERS